jgi:hypothetical protein
MEARSSKINMYWLDSKLGDLLAVVSYFTGPAEFQALQQNGTPYNYVEGKSKRPAEALSSLIVFSYVDGFTA